MTKVSDERALWLARNVLPHAAALRAWLKRRPAAAPEIDDIVQETYAILASLDSVEQIQNPRAYMFTVAHTVVLKHLRRTRIVPIEAMAELDRLSIPMDAPSPERMVADRQELRTIAGLIAALPAKCRQAFILRKIEGLPQKEIARRMGVSENTVEKHIGKGLRLLLEASARGELSVAGADEDRRTQVGKRDAQRDRPRSG